MKNLSLQIEGNQKQIYKHQKQKLMQIFLNNIDKKVRNILIIPPDYTRKHSGVGELTAFLYQGLKDKYEITIMPALGTHNPMTAGEIVDMFGPDIPLKKFVVHKWRKDTTRVLTIPTSYVSEITDSIVENSIEVELNQRLIGGDYDLIISIGQVLPHEVVGMANYNKNIFVGCGGSDMINKSHFVGAAYGMERIMGRDHTPVRKLYDYAQDNLELEIPLQYILTVNSTEVIAETGLTRMYGIFTGKERSVFEKAVKLSQKHNINRVDKHLKKTVVYLDQEEFKSTWLGCKAIYRTRMAIADEGELLVIAPGLNKFGEDKEIDSLIRKYGYVGRKRILELVQNNQDLQDNLAAAAHLIHGSSDGRFKITFACKNLAKEDIEGVNFEYMSLDKALTKYNPVQLVDGFNQRDGEQFYYISNPATGLWMA